MQISYWVPGGKGTVQFWWGHVILKDRDQGLGQTHIVMVIISYIDDEWHGVSPAN